jgi:hypothetical protein
MLIPNLYYYSSYFFNYYKFRFNIFFQIRLFKWYVTNVWFIMHIDTHFLKFKYFNYDNVKPFKNRSKAIKTYFFIWITNSFCVCNMGKHALNILWGNHENENLKWKVMIVLYVYFVQNETKTPNWKKWVKVGWKKHILSL